MATCIGMPVATQARSAHLEEAGGDSLGVADFVPPSYKGREVLSSGKHRRRVLTRILSASVNGTHSRRGRFAMVIHLRNEDLPSGSLKNPSTDYLCTNSPSTAYLLRFPAIGLL